jgi:hypothetical protein
VWTKEGRRKLAARLGRILGKPLDMNGEVAVAYRSDPEENQHGGWAPTMQRHLVKRAAAILIGQQGDPELAQTFPGLRKAGFSDVIDQIELKWRIRDWLSVTDVTNLPPNIRLAAAAAWEGGSRPNAYQIVMEAAVAPSHGA